MDFVICIDNSGYEASLEKRKIYALQSGTTCPDGFIAIQDETEQAYFFETSRFLPIELSSEIQDKLVSRS